MVPMSPAVLAIVAAVAVGYYAVAGAVAGCKKVVHGVKHAVVKIVHPHHKEA